MTWLQAIGDFFLTEWCWSITWGMMQLPFAWLYTFLLFKFIATMRLIPSLLLTFFSTIFAYALYAALVIGILFMIIDYEYVPHTETVCCEHVTALSLGIIYTVLQLFFFLGIKRWYPLNMRWVMAMSLLGNLLAAHTAYLLLPFFK